MTTVPIVIMASAASALGGYLLLLWFRKERRLVLIGFHVLLGFGAIEALVAFLHMGGLDDDDSLRRLAMNGVWCLGAAIASGFAAPLFRKSYSAANAMLAAHVAAGLAAFLVVLTVASRS